MTTSAHPRIRILALLCCSLALTACKPTEEQALYEAAKREVYQQHPLSTIVRPISEMTVSNALNSKFVTVRIERPRADVVRTIEFEFMAENDNWVLAPKEKSNEPFKTNMILKPQLSAGQNGKPK